MRQNQIKYQKLKKAIESEEVEKADQLTDDLLSEEGRHISVSIPEGFTDQIRFTSKKRGRKMNHKAIKTAAIAAVCVLGLGTSVYAAVPFIQQLAQDGGRAVFFTDEDSTQEIDVNAKDSEIEFVNPESESNDSVQSNEEWELLQDELYGDKTIGTYHIVDNVPSYMSDDGVNWVVNTEDAKTLIDRYVYKNVQEAFDKAEISNILAPLNTEYQLTSNMANAYECYTDQDSTVLSKNVRAILTSDQDKKIIASITHFTEIEDDSVTAMINGIDVNNYREVRTTSGATYALQDVNDEGNEHVAANLVTKTYTISLEFYGMIDEEIVEVINKLPVNELK